MMAQMKDGQFKILLADDGSEHAHAARDLVGDLTLPKGCCITVLRVFASTQAGDLALLEDALDQTCSVLKKKGLQTKPELLLGSPTEKVVEYAEEHKPDLIVMGAKGLRATLGILLGGVAQQVVEYAPCPVLVVRAPYQILRRILLVTDGSPSSLQAVQYLGKFPLPGSASLQVLHVLPPPSIAINMPEGPYINMQYRTLEQLSEADTAMRAKEEKDGQALLDRTIETLRSLGMEASGVLRRGDAATEIIDHVKEQKIDMIVSGSRGLSRIRSWLMGSVSRKLVHYSGCSVLVVRSQQPS